MKPTTPVFPSRPSTSEVVFAKDQPQYIPLPAHRAPDGDVTTRWRLSWKERAQVALFGDVWLTVLTFNDPLQPVLLMTEEPAERV
jgi:hypothetical protein